MHPTKYAILSLLILALCANAHADYSTQFIRYAVEDDLSRIVISWEQVRGVRGVDHMHANPEAVAAEGDFLTRGQYGGSEVITKVEEMDGHEVKTVITIRYPRGLGFGGACSNDSIKVYFDGELQLDSPMGYNHRLSMTVSKVTIHVQDKSIIAISDDSITGAHFHSIEHGEGTVLSLPKKNTK